MMSRPDLYRGSQYHPHPHGIDVRQTELDLAPGVAYNGCIAVLTTSIKAADTGKGLDCGADQQISFAPGVRYGDCTVVHAVTLAEADKGVGLLCDTDVDRRLVALGTIAPRIVRR